MIPNPDLYQYKCPIQVRWMDLDPLNHVNNSVYLQYFEYGRSKYMITATKQWNWHENMFLLAHASCDFKRELTLSDKNPEVWVRTARIGGKSFDLEYLITSQKEDKTIIHAVGKTVQVMFDTKARKTMPIPEWLKEELTSYEKADSIIS